MMKTTQKEIKEFYCEDIRDITNMDYEEAKKIKRLYIIAYSHGIYGVNGLVFCDEKKNFYKITCRNSLIGLFL